MRRPKDVTQIVARDLDTGKERLLYSVKPFQQIRTALSPDGSQLAFLNRGEDRVIRVIPTSGGRPRDVVHYRHVGNHIIEFAWSADGKYFLVPRNDAPPPPASDWSLWRFRVSDGQGEKILPKCGRTEHITVHPDGRRIAFTSTGAATGTAELWAIEVYLPVNNMQTGEKQ